MTYRELFERVQALADDAEANKTDDAQLIALILYTLLGAITYGRLRDFAQYVARWADAALRGMGAERN